MMLIPLHGLFMGLGFICMVIAIVIARYFRKKRWWLKFHRGLNISASSLALIGILIALIMVTPAYGMQLPLLHHLFGLATLVLLIAEPLLGFSIFKTTNKKKIMRLKKMHRIIGRITPVLYLITIIIIEFVIKD
ncbi:MAG: cytochrome b561 domain-containing protein [Candidatus Marinimicrobia bacterium]|nr:cytochrome b561 domain-containing protein [Candidatus Neomarinimicrobiota bacterium]